VLTKYRQLKHTGILEGVGVKKATKTSLGCGDKITVYILVDDCDIISVKYCALCDAPCAVVADLLIDKILENHLTVEDVAKMDIHSFLDEIDMRVLPTKIKSVALPLKTLKKALGV